ncbi:NAD(+) diphosphatase [Salibaculum griseiflavum]|uniref:NAD(+) diphosphatase n=1 Tax=Salibaculum griseiflavum TaxID=1914409 RepID=A0A2V1P323_9RHOB|nr:NAD(+) diphosphatase [Salibaculum griseiflavum]PWG16815.1 NAD(+) diphosphatase [Salibaculum griseiflavum]
MKRAETVTFGGSGLDRAAHLRGDHDAMRRLRASPGARFIAFWQGKVLISRDNVVRLRPDHALVTACSRPEIPLGCEGEEAVFGIDLSDWDPVGDGEALPDGSFFDNSVQRHPLAPECDGFTDLKACMTRLSPRDAELAATGRSLFAWHLSHRFCACCGRESCMVQAGWQRLCPDCGAPHFPRTDPVVIMLVTRGNRTLLGRGVGWPEGMFSCLAGFMEPGETVEAAVRREVLEETGVRVGRVDYLASQPWAFPSSLMIGCRAEAHSDAITLDPAELQEAQWVTREELAAAFAGDRPGLLPARRGAIAQFLLSNWLADRLD